MCDAVSTSTPSTAWKYWLTRLVLPYSLFSHQAVIACALTGVQLQLRATAVGCTRPQACLGVEHPVAEAHDADASRLQDARDFRKHLLWLLHVLRPTPQGCQGLQTLQVREGELYTCTLTQQTTASSEASSRSQPSGCKTCWGQTHSEYATHS